MNPLSDMNVALYLSLAIALAVWIGIFIYLWRIDSQAQLLKEALERQLPLEPQAVAPTATLTRVNESGTTKH